MKSEDQMWGELDLGQQHLADEDISTRYAFVVGIGLHCMAIGENISRINAFADSLALTESQFNSAMAEAERLNSNGSKFDFDPLLRTLRSVNHQGSHLAELLKKRKDTEFSNRNMMMINELMDGCVGMLKDMEIVSSETMRELYLYIPTISSSLYPCSFESPPKYGSDAGAEIEGKYEFRRWRAAIELPFEEMRNHYVSLLSGAKDTPVGRLTEQIRHLLGPFHAEIKNICDVNIDCSWMSGIKAEELIDIAYDNTKCFFEDPYDNSKFVESYDQCVGEGFFGDKYKYGYMIHKACDEEIKDRKKAFLESSTIFYQHFYSKYVNFYHLITRLAAERFTEACGNISSALQKSNSEKMHEIDVAIERCGIEISQAVDSLKAEISRFATFMEG